jgi:hypothetical protein
MNVFISITIGYIILFIGFTLGYLRSKGKIGDTPMVSRTIQFVYLMAFIVFLTTMIFGIKWMM